MRGLSILIGITLGLELAGTAAANGRYPATSTVHFQPGSTKDLFIGAEHDPVVLVTIKADRQRKAQLAALGLVAQPSIQPRADQLQLGLKGTMSEAELIVPCRPSSSRSLKSAGE